MKYIKARKAKQQETSSRAKGKNLETAEKLHNWRSQESTHMAKNKEAVEAS